MSTPLQQALSPYHFELPPEQIARHPPPEREEARLLCVGDPLSHRRVGDLTELLAPGDLLIVNDTQVMPARLQLRRRSGGRVEALLLGPGPGPVEALLKPSRRLKVGERLRGAEADFELELLQRGEEGVWQVQLRPEPLQVMQRWGSLPLPPYLERQEEPQDRERYQTTFSRHPGAVAAPTAGLHFTPALLQSLQQRGVTVARLTLHVGIGTFRPLRESDLAAGELHPESFFIPQETCDAVAACRASGGRVLAVGTTSTRALESATPSGKRVPEPGHGVTRLFIREGYRFRCVDLLMTNFHLPATSLLMLVAAFGGREPVLQAYREAVQSGYRFYSYGDAMLLPRNPA